MALVVTVACLPLLVLDLMGGQGGGASDQASVVTPEVPEPSLVVAVSPSEVPTTSSTTSTTAVVVADDTTTVTTAAPVITTTTTAPKLPKAAPTTTTTKPVAVAPPAPSSGGYNPTPSEASFLACVRHRESRGVYTAVDPTGQFMGAYQIYQGGWDAVARSIGRTDLVGVRPHHAAPADQDTIALAMLRQYGTKPWGGSCG